MGKVSKGDESVTDLSKSTQIPSTGSSPLLEVRKATSDLCGASSTYEKRGQLLVQDKQKWADRSCSIRNGTFYISKSSSDSDKKNRSRISLSSILGVRADPALGKPFAFELERKKDNIVLATSSSTDLKDWIDIFSKYIK